MSSKPSAAPASVTSASASPRIVIAGGGSNSGSNSGASNKIEIKVSAEGVAKLTFNFLDEQGDSSLEPGEVKTPPHLNSAVSPVPPPTAAPRPARVLLVEKPKSPMPKPKVATVPNVSVAAAAAVPVPAAVVEDDVVLVEEQRRKQKPGSVIVPLLKSSLAQRDDAAACEEKVRAILELDAIKRREEAEQRKQQLEKRRRSGELQEDEESKKKAKEERKRLKRLKKEQKAARLALLSDDEKAAAAAASDEEEGSLETSQKKKKLRRISKEHDTYENERLYSATSTHSSPERHHHHDELRSVVNSVAVSPSARYPPMSLPGPPPHLSHYPPDAFMGFRPMNPFIRGPRPDFHHAQRGGFVPRGRGGGMRGSMRFPGFRPPFYSGGNGPPPRHHGPPMTRPHTPPPARGHSPIQPPNANLIWTRTKPSISYAFNPHEDCDQPKPEQKAEDIISPTSEKSEKVNEKAARVASKLRKKAKKQQEREKVKKRRSSRHSSEKSSKRKIEKIRKSLAAKPKHRRSTTPEIPEIIQKRCELNKLTLETTPPTTPTNKRLKLDDNLVESVVPDTQEMRNVLENIKIEKVDIVDMIKEITPPFELIKDTIKLEVKTKESNALTFKIDNKTAVVDANVFAEAEDDDDFKNGKKTTTAKNSSVVLPKDAADVGTKKMEEDDNEFDMFAESPPRLTQKPSSRDIENLLHAARKASENKTEPRKHKKKAHTEQVKEIIQAASPEPGTPPLKGAPDKRCSITPPLPIPSVTKANEKTPEKTPLQKAIEIQKRIDRMLQGDDLKLEAIQVTKEKLLLQTKKHEEKRIELRGITPTTDVIEKPDRYKDKQEKPHTSRQRSLTPEPAPPKHRNPFKRSLSRDHFFGKIDSVRRSRSRTRDRETKSKRKVSSERIRNEHDRLRALSKGRQSGGSSAGSLNRSFSGERSVVYNSSLNRSHSKEHERNDRGAIAGDIKRRSDPKPKLSKSPRGMRRRRTISQDKSKSLERHYKSKRSLTPPIKQQTDATTPTVVAERAKIEKTKFEVHKKSTKKSKKTMLLSFTASEFLFPEENSEDVVTKITRKSIPKRMSNKKTRKPHLTSTAGESPDTDDYMDNWENDDADIDVHSSVACDSSTPVRSSKEDVDDKFETRFVNPSPPMELQQGNDEVDKVIAESTTPTTSPPPLSKPIENESTSDKETKEPTLKPKMSRNAFNKELFGMQELYDQFIKSVEESGVDMKTAQSLAMSESAEETSDLQGPDQSLQRTNEELLSTSSTSTTSSSSSSSSSDGTNSSSSSSSSTSGSSSDDSNDADSFKRSSAKAASASKIEPPEAMVALIEPATVAVDVENHSPVESILFTSDLPTSAKDPIILVSRPATPSGIPPVLTRDTAATQSSPPPPVDAIFAPAAPPSHPAATPVKAQKSNVAKDFKKLKSLEANLARIQMMRANYDSADEISEELLKMEKLFLQEKNLILQKYAKKTAVPIVTESTSVTIMTAPVERATTPPSSSGQFVNSLQQTEFESEPPPISNTIFDVNREAIKLTISPLKLPKTPAIFEKADDNEAETVTATSRRSKLPTEHEETYLAEKLVKPAKEIAIVKPMMETKEARSSHQHRHRHSSPSQSSTRSGGDRPRSPAGGNYRDRARQRSDSRSRLSPAQSRVGRNGRVRSLSMSPPRRAAGGRHTSPPRSRGTQQSSRHRNSGRRSTRSRSRSITRGTIRRDSGRDPSPQHRRRQQQQRTSGQPGHSSSSHRKTSSQHQRSLRDSRSRSPRSPVPLQLRPHSPRSPPPLSSSRRRSYSRERYSRSPLPFKPPSPPMRRSHSPPSQRSSCGGGRRSPHSRSSPARGMPRSPRSPPPSSHSRYDERDRRRRGDSYDRRSSESPSQRQYYAHELASAGIASSSSSSSYYYNVSPNRISLDARINIVLNGPPNQDGTSGGGGASYDNYSNYSQYGGGAAYMSVPPHPTSDAGNYYANQYVAASSSHPQQQVYSNIPTISGTGTSGGGSAHAVTQHRAGSNFYYNEFGGHPAAHHHSASLLKELPKAAVAVQKGNVLEIVPSTELSTSDCGVKSAAATEKTSANTQTKVSKVKSSKVSWKEEVNSRHVTAAVLRLSRETDGSSRSILKRVDKPVEVAKDDRPPKKKVYFEDGIFPNRDSDDEDRKMIDCRIRRKVQRLRKRHSKSGAVNSATNLLSTTTSTGTDKENRRRRKATMKIDPALEKLAPPPPPPGVPSPQVQQPIYLRPPTPTPLFYFHFDAVVHSMYVSQLERPIPPRLLNPKCMPGGISGSSSAGATQSPSSATATHSPIGTKKDLSAVNRSSVRSGSGRASPKTMPAAVTAQHMSTPTSAGSISSNNNNNSSSSNNHSPLNKGTFQTIAATTLPLSPQMNAAHIHTHTHPPLPPRQTAPIGFVGMRINNFMRLPPSPLARAPHPLAAPSGVGAPLPVIGLRHSYNMPPPMAMLPPPGMHQQHPHEFGAASPQAYSTSLPPPPHHILSYGGHNKQGQQPPPPHHHYNAPHQGPHSHHHHRQPPPGYFMQSAPPPMPVQPPPPAEVALMPTTAAHLDSSTQAMVARFKSKRAT